jgi:hypothetical protein
MQKIEAGTLRDETLRPTYTYHRGYKSSVSEYTTRIECSFLD